MGRNRVAADAQYLGIGILEPCVLLAERGRLRGSTRSEVEYVEGQYNVLLAFIVRQGNIPVGGWKFEIRGYIANFCRHLFASMNLDLSVLLGRSDWNFQIIPYCWLGDIFICGLSLDLMIYLAVLSLRGYEKGDV